MENNTKLYIKELGFDGKDWFIPLRRGYGSRLR